MPVIEPTNTQLRSYSGVHLWHAGLSSCSQRVRIALYEKGRAFKSHEINLQRGENASAAYQEIHPQGLVPAMVINGDLIIESIDILLEIERRFPDPALLPEDGGTRRAIEELMQRANAGHSALKLLTFEFLFSHTPKPPESEQTAFQAGHRNTALKQFHHDFALGFPRERIQNAVATSQADFDDLEQALADGRPFFAGSAFSLADIAWLPNVHRYTLFGWSFNETPYLKAWHTRMQARPSCEEALAHWQPPEIAQLIVPKIIERQMRGDGVDAYKRQP